MKIKHLLKILALILMGSLANVGVTGAYFSSQERVEGNAVSTGCWAKPETPQLIYPENGYVAALGSPWDLNPYMDWEDSTTSCPTGALTYTYESYHDETLTSLAYRSGPLNSSIIPAPGTPDGSYYWRVRAFDGSTWSGWSEAWLLVVDRSSPPLSPPLGGARVVINEVYYDVAGDKGSENNNEWVELYNAGDAVVSLKDWSLTDGQGNVKTINADVSLGPLSFAVLSHDNSTWNVHWTLPAETLRINWTGGSAWLNNGGDSLSLKDFLGVEQDFVAWESFLGDWNIGANEGQSIARRVKGVDADTVGDWEVLGSPNPGTNPHPPTPPEEEPDPQEEQPSCENPSPEEVESADPAPEEPASEASVVEQPEATESAQPEEPTPPAEEPTEEPVPPTEGDPFDPQPEGPGDAVIPEPPKEEPIIDPAGGTLPEEP